MVAIFPRSCVWPRFQWLFLGSSDQAGCWVMNGMESGTEIPAVERPLLESLSEQFSWHVTHVAVRQHATRETSVTAARVCSVGEARTCCLRGSASRGLNLRQKTVGPKSPNSGLNLCRTCMQKTGAKECKVCLNPTEKMASIEAAKDLVFMGI